jgi:hypothetical protein
LSADLELFETTCPVPAWADRSAGHERTRLAAASRRRRDAQPSTQARTSASRSAPDTIIKKLSSAGAFYLNKVQYLVGAQHGFQQVLVITNGDKPGDTITVTDLEGEILIEHTRPAPGTGYVGNARPPGPHTNKPRPSPKS